MGYIFIFLSVFANAAKGYCSKKISDSVATVNDALNINIIRNITCCIISAVIVLFNRKMNIFSMQPIEFILCLISGISMTLFLLGWTFAIKTDAYMLVSACASASFIVPCIAGLFMLNETVTPFKLISFVAIIAALYFLLRYNFSIKGKITNKQLLLLTIILLSQGINQTVQKLYMVYVPQKSAEDYTLYSFVFTAAALISAKVIIRNGSSGKEHTKNVVKNNLGYIAAMSVSLFGASFFQTLAAARIDAIILYPITNVLSLIAGSTMASMFFKEKLKKDCIIGIAFVLCALIFSKM
ncbi:MAG: EamA family transporter [Firmicutes bacterium]|nr:EamA family transporter [Bacillota bacterium]